MSLINRETDYALRIIRALSEKEYCSIPQICEDEHITRPFAYKISKKLEKGGFIGIKRGSRGGLFLSCDLGKTSLYDVMGALESLQLVNDCFESGYKCEIIKNGPCKIHHNLNDLQNRIYDELKNVFLKDILGISE